MPSNKTMKPVGPIDQLPLEMPSLLLDLRHRFLPEPHHNRSHLPSNMFLLDRPFLCDTLQILCIGDQESLLTLLVPPCENPPIQNTIAKGHRTTLRSLPLKVSMPHLAILGVHFLPYLLVGIGIP